MTNNPLTREKYEGKYPVEYHSATYLELLVLVRDKIHAGSKLLTHPLAGSIKPNETPFRSILLEGGGGAIDFDSVRMIEEGIAACRKFGELRFPNLSEQARQDFALIDLSLIDSAMESLGAAM